MHKKNKRKINKWVLPSILTAFLLAAIILKPVFFKKPVFVFGYAPCLVATSSMEPSYPAHSLVLLKRVPLRGLKTGDVAAFESDALGGQVALHRVTQITDGGFYTKGDNSKAADFQLITQDEFVGISVFKSGLPLGKALKLTRPRILIPYIICPLLAAVTGAYLIKLVKPAKKKA